MQFFLKKHAPGAATHLVKANIEINDRLIAIDFTVSKRDNSEFCANPDFGDDYSKNWGLWETDVVEAFIQLRSSHDDISAPYLEIQLSPLNQPFALIIKRPRQEFYYPESLIFTHSSDGEDRTWRARLSVSLPEDLQGNFIYLGLNACLGIGDREFFALNPNPEEKPDFHRPEFFIEVNPNG